MLSRIGIGAAVVDTVLPKRSFELGETFEVEVNVQGGAVEQEIQGIYLALLTLLRDEFDDLGLECAIEKVQSGQAFTIAPGEKKSFAVPLTIPYHSPLTFGSAKVWLKTGLDLEWSLDPKDEDDLEVRPDGRMRALIDAIESLGFMLRYAQSGGLRHARPFVQELAFVPSESELRGRVHEIELICDCSERQVNVLVEVDRRARGLLGALGVEHKSKSRYSFTEPNVAAIAQELRRLIESSLR